VAGIGVCDGSRGVCVQAKRTLEAPTQVHRRLLRRSVNADGGWGGRRQDRHFVYSRFRSATWPRNSHFPCFWVLVLSQS
jgi:hypothetical protein